MKRTAFESAPNDAFGESSQLPLPEQDEIEIANWVSIEATALFDRLTRTGIEVRDTTITPNILPILADGLHREQSSFGLSTFITRNGKKTYELSILDSTPLWESSSSIRLASYMSDEAPASEGSRSTEPRIVRSGLRISVNPEGVIYGKSSYRLEDDMGSQGHGESLSKEEKLAGSIEILGAIKTALETFDVAA